MEYFILKSKLINLLINKSKPNSITEMKNAYENFVINVLALNQPEVDYSIVFRTLNLTRIEFQSLQTQILYEQGEKCPKISLLAESYFCYRF